MELCKREDGRPNLGFGYMRLPMTDGRFDLDSVNEMVDAFMAHGYYYFDTAHVYQGSEEALRRSLVERYPRDRYWITTKCNIIDMKDPAGMQEQLDLSLSRLGVDHVDAYFLHAMSGPVFENADRLGAWGFLKRLKDEGVAKHIGFSYHGTPEDLIPALERHPEVELVQLQINYLDWESEDMQAHKLYDIVRSFGKWVTVMEPCKGGQLTSEDTPAGRLLKAASPEASAASWAFRFVAGLDGIFAILSGMGNLAQMEDNAHTFASFRPLSAEERALVDQAAELIRATPRVPCTACRYCSTHCPKSLPIPTYLKFYNDLLMYNTLESTRYIYRRRVRGERMASNCIGCKTCERHCPQHIPITDYIKKVQEQFEAD